MTILLKPQAQPVSRVSVEKLREIERLRVERRIPYKDVLAQAQKFVMKFSNSTRSVKDIGGLTQQEAQILVKWLEQQGYRIIESGNGSNKGKILSMDNKPTIQTAVQENVTATTATEIRKVKSITLELTDEQSVQLAKIQEWYRSPSALHTLRLMIEDMSKGVEVGNPISRLGNNTRVEPLK